MVKYISEQQALAAKYPFAAIPDPDGDGWEIVFPDIAGVVGFSETWEGIGEEAKSILAEWIEVATEDHVAIPVPDSDWDPIERKPGAFRLPRLSSSEDVANELGISVRRVQALAASRGTGHRIGNALVFTPDDIDAMRERTPGRPRKDAAAV